MKKFIILVSIIVSMVTIIALSAVGYNQKSKPCFAEVVSSTDSITTKTVNDNLDINISFINDQGKPYTISQNAQIIRSINDNMALLSATTNTTFLDKNISTLFDVVKSKIDLGDIATYLNGDKKAFFSASVKDNLINLGVGISKEENFQLSHSNIIGGINTDDFEKLFKDTHIENISELTVAKLFALTMRSWTSKSQDTASAKKDKNGIYNYSYKVDDYASFAENYAYTFLDNIFVDKQNTGYTDIKAFYSDNKETFFSHFIPLATSLNADVSDDKISSINAKGGFTLKFSDEDILGVLDYFGIDSTSIASTLKLLHLCSIGYKENDTYFFEIVVNYELDENISYEPVSFDTTLPIFEERDFTELDEYGVIPIITNSIGSYFNPESNAETEAFREKYGIIKGISHGITTEQGINDLLEANIEYVRKDTGFPFLFDENGNVTDIQTTRYKQFKEDCIKFQAAGIKVIACTPYPSTYNIDWDNVTAEDEQFIKDIALYLMEDLNGLVDCIQIANELDMASLVEETVEQCAYFVGTTAQAMSTVKEEYNIIIGYNSTLAGGNYHKALLPYMEYMDYAGVDIYFGCFDSLSKEMYLFNMINRSIWNLTKKPVIVMEFGYISEGKAKTDEEKLEILRRYGYKNEDEAKKDIVNFVNNWPEGLKSFFTKHYKDQSTWAADIFETPFFMSEIKNHFYAELGNYYLNGYEHTLKGQAKFYEDLLPSLMAQDFVGGLAVYNYADDDECWKCHQQDCPIEGKWGIVDKEGNRKPAWYAIRDAFE